MTLSEIKRSYSQADSDASLRMDLVREIHRLEDCDWKDAELFLCQVLSSDPDPIVRHEAAFFLGELRASYRIGDELASIKLCEAAISDSSIVVRHEAAEALYPFNGDQVKQTLDRLLGDPSEDVRFTAAISILRHKRRNSPN